MCECNDRTTSTCSNKVEVLCVCASIITLHCVSVSDDDDDDGVIPLDDKARKRAALATGGKNLHMNEDKNQIP